VGSVAKKPPRPVTARCSCETHRRRDNGAGLECKNAMGDERGWVLVTLGWIANRLHQFVSIVRTDNIKGG
jgi:hypothetical protein